MFGVIASGISGNLCQTVGGWVELSRHELNCASDLITVNGCGSGFAVHENLMFLKHIITPASGQMSNNLTFNGSCATLHAERSSKNGAADVTEVAVDHISLESTVDDSDDMSYGYIKNVAGQEKLGISHSVSVKCAGECTEPNRRETVFKWDPASLCTNITRLDIACVTTGTFTAGSQVIVLGWDKCNTHAPECAFWQPLGQTTLTSASDNIEVASFTAKEWLMVNHFSIACGSICTNITFNNDTCTNYATRVNNNGASDNTFTNRANIDNLAVVGKGQFMTNIIRNQSDKEKLLIGHIIESTGAGECSAPARNEVIAKWDNTASQITTIDFTNVGGGSVTAGSYVQVWGAN